MLPRYPSLCYRSKEVSNYFNYYYYNSPSQFCSTRKWSLIALCFGPSPRTHYSKYHPCWPNHNLSQPYTSVQHAFWRLTLTAALHGTTVESMAFCLKSLHTHALHLCDKKKTAYHIKKTKSSYTGPSLSLYQKFPKKIGHEVVRVFIFCFILVTTT